MQENLRMEGHAHPRGRKSDATHWWHLSQVALVKKSERYWRNSPAAPPAQTSGFATLTNTSGVEAVSLANIQGPDNRSASLSASDNTVMCE